MCNLNIASNNKNSSNDNKALKGIERKNHNTLNLSILKNSFQSMYTRNKLNYLNYSKASSYFSFQLFNKPTFATFHPVNIIFIRIVCADFD